MPVQKKTTRRSKKAKNTLSDTGSVTDDTENPYDDFSSTGQDAFLSAGSTFELVKTLYKNDYGDPFEMTPTQNLIFDEIFTKKHKRVHVMTYTQFGKSEIVSMAILTRVATFAEKWVILAPSEPKAKIIIGYIIKHIFENAYIMERFKIEKGESAERLRRERSANRLTFKTDDGRVGEVFILSTQSHRKRDEDIGNALMGFGAPNIVMDEAALIDDRAEAKAMRMVGGFTKKGTDFVVKIGNPFNRNHFLKAFNDPKYVKINADYNTGIQEGRLTQSFIDEMMKKPFFRVMYENRFPEDNTVDDQGWTPLFTDDEIDKALFKGADGPFGRETRIEHAGELRIGQDVARGGNNFTVWVLRSMNYAEILEKSNESNLTEIGGKTITHMKDSKVDARNVFIDDVGVGGGVVDSLQYQLIQVRGTNVGNTALESARFANLRAEAYWRLREWIKKGGKLNNSSDWFELCRIRYKPDHKGRIKIMPKDDMRARGLESPDVADALMLTFARAEHVDLEDFRQRRERKKRMRVQGRGLKFSMGGY